MMSVGHLENELLKKLVGEHDKQLRETSVYRAEAP